MLNRHIAHVLSTVTRAPGRPRLTWYGDGGERVELSGAVLENWVAKTVNLLVEELDAGPGTVVVVDLPAHWRTAVWALAAWRAGAHVVLAPDPADALGTRPDVVVTDRPDAWSTTAGLVAVSLPALARKYDGTLPPGALDAAAAVMTYGDALGWVPDTDPAADALTAPGVHVRHSDLLAWADVDSPAHPGSRVLVETEPAAGRPAGAERLLRALTATLGADGSVVALSPEMTVELAAAPARRERLVASERVDSVLGPAPRR